MVTSKGKKVKGIAYDEKIINTINKRYGNKRFTKELLELGDIIYKLVSDEVAINNSSTSTLRKCRQIEKNDLINMIKKLDREREAEEEKFKTLSKTHEEYISQNLKEKNTLEKLLKDTEKNIQKYDENIRENETYKKFTLRKILKDYKSNNLTPDVLKNDINESIYDFTIEEFKEYSKSSLEKYLNSEISIAPRSYLLKHNIDENEVLGVSKEYKLFIDEKIISDIDHICNNLLRIVTK